MANIQLYDQIMAELYVTVLKMQNFVHIPRHVLTCSHLEITCSISHNLNDLYSLLVPRQFYLEG